MDRRTVLKGVLALSAIPAVAAASSEPEGQIKRLLLTDNHAFPFVASGDIAIYDTSDRRLEPNKVYVTLTDKKKMLFIGKARRDAQGLWWLERYARSDWYGPMTEEFFQARIIGRVKATWKVVA